MTLFSRDGVEVQALVTDRYLELLLLAEDRHAPDTPADPALDPAIRGAARRLSANLVRVHPSFRFEERLAARLAEAAARMRLSTAAGGEGDVIPVPFPTLQEGAGDHDETPTAAPGQSFPRPLVIGGALTSAALSLAGAAYVAWRRGRSPLARPRLD